MHHTDLDFGAISEGSQYCSRTHAWTPPSLPVHRPQVKDSGSGWAKHVVGKAP